MSATLNYRAVEAYDGGYSVDVSVTEAEEIPTELFVARVGGAYSHVAKLADIAMFPPSETEAHGLGLSYYRSAAMRIVAADPATARAARNNIVNGLRAVLAAFKATRPPDFGATVDGRLT